MWQGCGLRRPDELYWMPWPKWIACDLLAAPGSSGAPSEPRRRADARSGPTWAGVKTGPLHLPSTPRRNYFKSSAGERAPVARSRRTSVEYAVLIHRRQRRPDHPCVDPWSYAGKPDPGGCPRQLEHDLRTQGHGISCQDPGGLGSEAQVEPLTPARIPHCNGCSNASPRMRWPSAWLSEAPAERCAAQESPDNGGPFETRRR
jgi:hypothetical protein